MESSDNLTDQSDFGLEAAEEGPRDLSNPDDGRLMYYEKQLQFDPRHTPPTLADWTPDEARVMLEMLFGWSNLGSWDYPLPCRGLPGLLHTKYDRDEQAAELLTLGMDYMSAVVHNERKSMHNRWREAREFIYKIQRDAEGRVREEFVQAQVRQAVAREAEIEATPQLVYFIGAASGPIKIGIAISPQNRLRGLQTGHHEKLELLATCPGGAKQERCYHETFANRRLNGEWFERCPEIEAEIDRLI